MAKEEDEEERPEVGREDVLGEESPSDWTNAEEEVPFEDETALIGSPCTGVKAEEEGEEEDMEKEGVKRGG